MQLSYLVERWKKMALKRRAEAATLRAKGPSWGSVAMAHDARADAIERLIAELEVAMSGESAPEHGDFWDAAMSRQQSNYGKDSGNEQEK